MDIFLILKIVSILAILLVGFFLLRRKVLAASPAATLTIDGVLHDTFLSVQEAVNAIAGQTGRDFVIEIAEGIVSDPLDILQLENKNVVIKPQEGATVTFTNTITIDGNGRLSGEETLLIQGLNFDFTSGSPENCIYFNLLPGRTGHAYAHNVTINGCTFRGVFNEIVAVQSIPGGSRNISIINCTATDMHSLAQLKAISGYAFIQNCTLSNSDGGVNFYGTGDLFVDSCNFDVVGYAVRSGQGSGTILSDGSVTVNNSILNNNSNEDGTIVLRGDSTRNINVVHSNITNANSGGSSIQNLNLGSLAEYKIDIVESNITGSINNISPPTVRLIDDPNIENGPICLSENGGSDDSIIKKIINAIIKFFEIIFFVALSPLIALYRLIRWIFGL